MTAVYLLGDRGYDTDEIIGKAVASRMEPVIPPKKNCKEQRFYNKYIFKIRHLVENAFLYLKQWRGIATRYAKNTASFVAAVQSRCITVYGQKPYDDTV
jgi:transposase